MRHYTEEAEVAASLKDDYEAGATVTARATFDQSWHDAHVVEVRITAHGRAPQPALIGIDTL